MSQIYKSTTAGNLPPVVPTSFITDDGTAIPVNNELEVIGNSTAENNVDGIQTTGSGNVVGIELTNRVHGTATSTNSSNADIIIIGLGTDPAVFRFEFKVAGRSTAGAAVDDGVGYSVYATVKTDGAAATLIGTPFQDADEDAALTACTIALVTSANNIILRANGIGGETIDYTAVGYYVVV